MLDFRSTTTRDEWISAIVSAQERAGSDCDDNGTELETEDSDGRKRQSTSTSLGTDHTDSIGDDGEGYNDALLALQSVRDSVMQCHLSMGDQRSTLSFRVEVPPQPSRKLRHH